MTVPMDILQQWLNEERWMPDEHYRPESKGLKHLAYEEIPVPVKGDYTKYPIAQESGDLLDEGLQKFIKDWKGLLKQEKK